MIRPSFHLSVYRRGTTRQGACFAYLGEITRVQNKGRKSRNMNTTQWRSANDKGSTNWCSLSSSFTHMPRTCTRPAHGGAATRHRTRKYTRSRLLGVRARQGVDTASEDEYQGLRTTERLKLVHTDIAADSVNASFVGSCYAHRLGGRLPSDA